MSSIRESVGHIPLERPRLGTTSIRFLHWLELEVGDKATHSLLGNWAALLHSSFPQELLQSL